MAHIKQPSAHLRKLDDRNKLTVYIGREQGTKASRLYDPEAKKILVSRDVVFEEQEGWSWDNTQEAATGKTSGTFIVCDAQSNGETRADELEIPENGSNEEEVVGQETEGHESDENNDGNARKSRLLSDIYNETSEVELEEELLLTGIDEPNCYEQALKEPGWVEAMKIKLEAIERNNTWRLEELPAEKKPIGLKWFYKLKREYKARLVAKGYVQRQGIDIEEVFAPVTRLETVRLLLALVAKNEWEVHHLDVKSAFLNEDLNEVVYVTQPEGFVKREGSTWCIV